MCWFLHGPLYVCKSWSVTLKENHKLQVPENLWLCKIFGLRDEGIGELQLWE